MKVGDMGHWHWQMSFFEVAPSALSHKGNHDSWGGRSFHVFVN